MPRRGSWTAVAAVALTVATAAAAPAGAAEPASRPYAVTALSGTVTMSFHGDADAGCAERGLCGVTGVARYTVKRRGSGLAVFTLTRLGPTLLGTGLVSVVGTTTATVNTPGTAACTDTLSRSSETLAMIARTGGLVVGLGDATLAAGVATYGASPRAAGPVQATSAGVFDVHCAGPRRADIAAALPRGSVRRGELLRPRPRIAMTGTRSFRGGGFAGTIAADVRVSLRRAPCPPRDRAGCRRLDAALRAGS